MGNHRLWRLLSAFALVILVLAALVPIRASDKPRFHQTGGQANKSLLFKSWHKGRAYLYASGLFCWHGYTLGCCAEEIESKDTSGKSSRGVAGHAANLYQLDACCYATLSYLVAASCFGREIIIPYFRRAEDNGVIWVVAIIFVELLGPILIITLFYLLHWRAVRSIGHCDASSSKEAKRISYAMLCQGNKTMFHRYMHDSYCIHDWILLAY